MNIGRFDMYYEEFENVKDGQYVIFAECADGQLLIGEVDRCGFDDLDYLSSVGTPMSTVNRSFKDMGRQAMELLQQRLKENENEPNEPHGMRTRIYQKPMLHLCGSEKLKGLK